MNVIEAEKLNRRFKNVQALRDLSFSVGSGEIFGFLGPNGAGKTTAIKILTAQLRPDSGSARVLGFDVIREPGRILEKIGVVFEDQNFYPRLTVIQNLEFFARLYSRDLSDVDRVISRVQLDHKKKEEAQKLSRGLKQRLMIARALLPDPQVIFLDEPTVGLDPHVARDIRCIFKDLRSQGKTIFLTTHYMEEADELCDRVAVINQGSIVAMDTPERLKDTLGPREFVLKVFNQDGSLRETLAFAHNNQEGAKIITGLMNNGVEFQIIPRRISLEDVFIKLTGETLEEGSDGGNPACGKEPEASWGK